MVGSSALALPWAYSTSGFLFGLVLSFIGFLISYYTCSLIIKTAGKDDQYYDTLYKYWGRKGYYGGIISTALVCIGAEIAYFVLLTQLLYPIPIAIQSWVTGNNSIELNYDPDFDRFSPAYAAIIMFVVESLITSKKELGFFIKIVSYGAIFIISLIIFIICFGIYGLASTDFQIVDAPVIENYSTDVRHLALYSSNFSSLLGMLSVGFFLHPLSIEIVKNNRDQTKNYRDTFLGYFLVFFSYAAVGTMGYIGFKGNYFDQYYLA